VVASQLDAAQRDVSKHRDPFVTRQDTNLGPSARLRIAYRRVARANEVPEALEATRADAGSD